MSKLKDNDDLLLNFDSQTSLVFMQSHIKITLIRARVKKQFRKNEIRTNWSWNTMSIALTIWPRIVGQTTLINLQKRAKIKSLSSGHYDVIARLVNLPKSYHEIEVQRQNDDLTENCDMLVSFADHPYTSLFDGNSNVCHVCDYFWDVRSRNMYDLALTLTFTMGQK